MPNPADYSSQEEFMKACVPMVMGEGKTNEQAVGQCMGMWNNRNSAKKSVMSCMEICAMCVDACVACMRACMASQYANTPAAKACMDACHHCIAACEYCAQICRTGTTQEIEQACRDCAAACNACTQACAVCAVKCPDCRDACNNCSHLCQQCAQECEMLTGQTQSPAMNMSMKSSTTQYYGTVRFTNAAVKVAGDWALDVIPVPFGSKQSSDSDGQWFDPMTDIKEKVFTTPLVIYQHGIKAGARGMQEKPIVIGDSIAGTWKKKSDGWHIRVELDPTKEEAKSVMDAAYKSAVAVSSDSISHLARLDIGGKLIQYEKNRPGRIAVWPLAGFSLWDMGNGNFRPANRMAMALPAMKAMYREAGLAFPELKDTPGVSNYISDEMAKRAKVAKEQAQIILKNLNR